MADVLSCYFSTFEAISVISVSHTGETKRIISSFLPSFSEYRRVRLLERLLGLDPCSRHLSYHFPRFPVSLPLLLIPDIPPDPGLFMNCSSLSILTAKEGMEKCFPDKVSPRTNLQPPCNIYDRLNSFQHLKIKNLAANQIIGWPPLLLSGGYFWLKRLRSRVVIQTPINKSRLFWLLSLSICWWLILLKHLRVRGRVAVIEKDGIASLLMEGIHSELTE